MSETFKKNENAFILNLTSPIQEFPVYQYPEANESFLKMPSAVQEVIGMLETIENANKMDSVKAAKKSNVVSKEEDDMEILVTFRKRVQNQSTSKRAKLRDIPLNTNQFTFMRQIEPEQEDRILARTQRESVANTFRRLGNFEYRKLKYDEAINYYTKGLTYIKDTPVLYVNRAICYIKLREYKRGIMDCDYVLANIDEKYVRAWLYRAAAYKRMDDEPNYDYSVYKARQLNRMETKFIDDFLEKMPLLF